MTEPTGETTTPPNIPPFYRRTYLIDKKGQLKTTIKVAGVVAFLVPSPYAEIARELLVELEKGDQQSP